MAVDLPESVRAFLASHIDSLDQLEMLTLLHGAPDRRFTVDDVVTELRLSANAVVGRIQKLHASGLLAREEASPVTYRYAPADPARSRLVDEVLQTYRERRVAVTIFVFSKPSDDVTAFADAFKFKKGKP